MSKDVTSKSGNAEPLDRGTVFLVDDDPGVRTALGRVFRSVGYDVRRFESAEDFLDAVSPGEAGCLVLDIKMPGMTGLELQEHLSTRGFVTPIIFITGFGNVPASVRAMKQGAIDFFQKPLDHHKLLDMVDGAVKRDLEVRRRRRDRDDARGKFDILTPREFEVMTWMIGGTRNRDIADGLHISEKTVKIHRGRVMKKMQAESLADVIRVANDAGIPAHQANPSATGS